MKMNAMWEEEFLSDTGALCGLGLLGKATPKRKQACLRQGGTWRADSKTCVPPRGGFVNPKAARQAAQAAKQAVRQTANLAKQKQQQEIQAARKAAKLAAKLAAQEAKRKQQQEAQAIRQAAKLAAQQARIDAQKKKQEMKAAAAAQRQKLQAEKKWRNEQGRLSTMCSRSGGAWAAQSAPGAAGAWGCKIDSRMEQTIPGMRSAMQAARQASRSAQQAAKQAARAATAAARQEAREARQVAQQARREEIQARREETRRRRQETRAERRETRAETREERQETRAETREERAEKRIAKAQARAAQREAKRIQKMRQKCARKGGAWNDMTNVCEVGVRVQYREEELPEMPAAQQQYYEPQEPFPALPELPAEQPLQPVQYPAYVPPGFEDQVPGYQPGVPAQLEPLGPAYGGPQPQAIPDMATGAGFEPFTIPGAVPGMEPSAFAPGMEPGVPVTMDECSPEFAATLPTSYADQFGMMDVVAINCGDGAAQPQQTTADQFGLSPVGQVEATEVAQITGEEAQLYGYGLGRYVG